MKASEVTCSRTEPDRVVWAGALTFDHVRQAVSQGSEFLQEHRPIIFDLKDVVRCDSAGLAVVLEWMRLARQQGSQLKFVNLPDKMVDLARVSCLDGILPLG